MALLTKTLAEFVAELEDDTGRELIALSFKPVATGNPTRFIAVFQARRNPDRRTDTHGNTEVWDVGP